MTFIPNTTPTPNWLYNGEMKKMSDTELRIVLMVTRATLGWVLDRDTGRRKEEDWISRSQLIEKTGRSKESVNQAITRCIKMGWIEVRDKNGFILNTPKDRSGKKLYYRLGGIFTEKLTSQENGQVRKPAKISRLTSQESRLQPAKNLGTTKETLTKEIIQKDSFDLRKLNQDELRRLVQ